MRRFGEEISDFNRQANSPQFEKYSLFTNRRSTEWSQIRQGGRGRTGGRSQGTLPLIPS